MNISVIGSCQSRDIFNSKFIKEYKKHFNLSSYFSMTSIVSIMGNTIKYNYSNLIKTGYKDCLMEHWYQELEKNLLKTLKSKQPDVLLMDFPVLMAATIFMTSKTTKGTTHTISAETNETD